MLEESVLERQKKLEEILKKRGLVDEACECGHWRSEHEDVGPAIGHGKCLRCSCEHYRWVPKPNLKPGQQFRGTLSKGNQGERKWITE